MPKFKTGSDVFCQEQESPGGAQGPGYHRSAYGHLATNKRLSVICLKTGELQREIKQSTPVSNSNYTFYYSSLCVPLDRAEMSGKRLIIKTNGF